MSFKPIIAYQLGFHPYSKLGSINISTDGKSYSTIANLSAPEFNVLAALLGSGATAVSNDGWIVGVPQTTTKIDTSKVSDFKEDWPKL